MAEQVKNGKAFEFALANSYAEYLQEQGVQTELVINDALSVAQAYYQESTYVNRRRYDYCAAATIDTMVKIEPGLIAKGCGNDVLRISLNEDSAGEIGDVRDVVFQRPKWEIGFSAKNNNDAVKHSRLSNVNDFGKSWFGVACSQTYWNDIEPIFAYISEYKGSTWEDLGENKAKYVYMPLLEAFRKEVMYINSHNDGIPQKLIRYLLGRYAFYKIIKDDANNLVIVKSFNLEGELNKTYGGVKPRCKIPAINLPTRIVEFKMKDDSDNTLNMILDGGWEISFRIHNASTRIETSLKFDVKLLGNPPVLFTQHIFQDNEIN